MAVAEVLPPPVVDGETARQAVADVLGRPEYGGLEPSWWDRVVDALAQGLGRVVDALTGTATGSAIGWIILAVLAVGVLLLGRRAVRGLRREGSMGVATAGDVGRSPEEWLADADVHEADGRWRDAVRCRYRALVAALARAAVLEEVPGRTAGEYLTAVGASLPGAAPSFARVTAVFERAWYGAAEVGADDVAAIREAGRASLAAGGLDTSSSIGASA